MTDKTLVERVIAWLDGGCSSWNVPSSDIRQMATRIEALEAALRDIKIEAMREKGSWAHFKRVILLKCKQALESQP